MGDEGEFWHAVKEDQRRYKEKYETLIEPMISSLTNHPKCKYVGDHYRIDEVWDFWWTGTVRNIKTGKNIDIKKLFKMYINPT